MRLFDSHCHLQDERLLGDVDRILKRSRRAGVAAVLCCGSMERDWPVVLDLAARHGEIRPALGLHPLYVRERSPGWDADLERRLRDSGAAVGEIGLDHAIEPRDDADQEAVFERQLRMAIDLGRPVSIHCRRAWERLTSVLKACGVPRRGAVIHSYSGSLELVPPLLDLGVSFSFSGSITRVENRRGRLAAAAVPADRLLIETDAPDLMPAAEAGATVAGETVNEPANLFRVAECLAGLRGVTADALAERTWENAARIFGRAG